MRFSQCLPILRTHPQVPPRKTVSFYLFFLQKQKNIGMRSIQEDTLCTRCFHFCEKKDLKVSQMRNFLTSFSSAENS